ncbi:hypothetical protein [Actinomadura sp. WMMB 499]|uniref:hypothetical protein n=1 Tax=Actinomadura sp. WMMB 499 TaxID=1219491 RepID=UPI0012458665|nr:hypothetical protein [Actinomadura sp. WMMB 499]QFG22845.1 hypothetical protein F7P10_18720 [Actinomadura sp. WMMB 499]
MPDLPAAIGGDMLQATADGFESAVGWLISNTAAWWVDTPSPNLEQEPAIGFLQDLIQPLTIFVALAALLVVAGKLALTRKATPLIGAGQGLVVLVTVTVIGTLLPNQLLQLGDLWSDWALTASSQGEFATRMAKIVAFPSGTPAALVIVLCLVAMFIGIIQALLLLFRGAALVVLAGVLPLAAAGMITTTTRPWFGKVAGWMLALVFYKPAAAAVYATAFTFIGEGEELHTVLMGFTMMLISLIAFPVLLKFFSWPTGGTESSTGGGVLNAVMGGATALGALRAYGGAGSGGRGESAGEHADYLGQQLGEQPGPPHEGDQKPQPDPAQGQQAPGQSTVPGEQGQAPVSPSGSEQPDGGMTEAPGRTAGGEPSGSGWAPPGGHDEPVGPTTVRTADKEMHRGQDTIRWLGNPTGSGNDDNSGPGGGPSGAAGEGGGGHG